MRERKIVRTEIRDSQCARLKRMRAVRNIGILLSAFFFSLSMQSINAQEGNGQEVSPPLDTALRPTNYYRNAADSMEVMRLMEISFNFPPPRRDSALIVAGQAATLAEASVPDGLHVDVAGTWHWVGRHALNRGQHERAAEAFRHELALRDRLAGPDHPDRANCIDHLGRAIRAGGNPSEALPYYRQAFALRKRYYAGTDHPDLAGAVNNLALVESNLGHFSSADSLYRESLAMKRRIYKEDDIDLATTMLNLGLVQLEMGNVKEGTKNLEEATDMLRRTKTDKPILAAGVAGVARAYYTGGRYDTALTLATEAFEIRRAIFHGDHPAIASSHAVLGRLLWKAGKRAEGEPMIREAIAMSERLHPDGHAFTASAILELGTLLRESGEKEKAEPVLTDALSMRRDVLGEGHPHIAAAMIELSRAQIGSESTIDPDAITEALKEAEDALNRNFSGPHPLKIDLYQASAELAQSEHRTEVAIAEYRKAAQMYANLFPEGHPERSELLNVLADELEEIGDTAAAKRMREEAAGSR